jgi:SHS2 domain-containing protein
MGRRFEEVEHTADIAIRVWGDDMAELFASAAYGMACQLAELAGVDLTVERLVNLESYDVETLLVDWLGELLYLGERDECVFVDFDMREVTSTRLQAVARGGVPREYRHHIKAVTFNELEIQCAEAGCETTIVFDV